MKSTKWLYFLVVLFTFSACREHSVPYAYFEYEVKGLTVNFTNISRNALYKEWNFGDGSTSNEVSPKHKYAESGTYMVTLTVYNEDMESSHYTVPIKIRDLSSVLYVKSITIDTFDFRKKDGSEWDENEVGGYPDIYLAIAGEDGTEFHTTSVSLNVREDDLPLTKEIRVLLDKSIKYTIYIRDYDDSYDNYDPIVHFEFYGMEYDKEQPETITYGNDRFRVTLNLKWTNIYE